jgi:hypothetical protein
VALALEVAHAPGERDLGALDDDERCIHRRTASAAAWARLPAPSFC